MGQVIGELEELINQGRYFEARSRAEVALKNDNLPRLRQLLSLAISKSGMPELALDTIGSLYQQFPDDPESAGILGSIYKELFKKNQKTSFAVQSRDTYLKNFQATQNYYTGINAASMSAMAGQGSKGREIANQVIGIVEKLDQNFWESATLGEAYLLNKNKTKAIEYYIAARKSAGNDWGKVTSVHNQLWLLNHYIAVPGEVMKLFAPPNVVAFSGHMIDQPGRDTPRFPPEIETHIKESIRNSIRTCNARIGYSSLSCGSDIIFVETMIEEGGEVNIWLPFQVDDFIKTSIAFAGPAWINRFNKIISSHSIQYTTKGGYGNNDELFAFLSQAIYGSAILRSNATHSEPYLLTVSSEIDLKKKTGGTKDTVTRWPFPQHHININPDIFTATIKTTTTNSIGGLRFDSRLEEIRCLAYIGFDSKPEEVLARINKYKEKTVDETLSIETTNEEANSFIMAFASSSGVMEFVNHFRQSRQLSRDHTFKIALHAGTTTTTIPSEGSCVDDLRQMGDQVSSGSIFASELFASILVLNTKNYRLQYAGVLKVENQEARPFYNVEFLH